LSELNIEILCANTSQAKGRVERAHYTLRDRLVKELRLKSRNARRSVIAVVLAQQVRNLPLNTFPRYRRSVGYVTASCLD
jgi:hypothetical protein